MSRRNRIILAALIIVIFVAGIGVKQYRRRIYCAKQNAALRQQLDRLEDDAREQLRIGADKDQIIRFFERHQMSATFHRGKASGDLRTTGCAPFGCGADTAIIGVSIAIDSQERVSGEPHVSGIYTDCL